MKRIESKDGEPIMIRPFLLGDLRRLHQMNPYISAETRRAYRAMLPQPRPPLRQVRRLMLWGLVEIKLAMSSIGFLRHILAFVPRLAYIAFVAVNPSDQIVGFRFFNIVGRRARHNYIVEGGTVLRDDYQGRGIAKGFTDATFEAVDNEVLLVFGEIYEWNSRAIEAVRKHEHKWIGTYRKEDGEVVRLYARGRGAEGTQSQRANPTHEASTASQDVDVGHDVSE